MADDPGKEEENTATDVEGSEEDVQAEDVQADEEAEDQDEQEDAGNKSLDLILDIPLTVTVELGRSKMLINDLLQLGQGSVVELTKMVGEPLEVLVNQKLVARGEVVVVNEKFGIRLTDIISPMERVQSLS